MIVNPGLRRFLRGAASSAALRQNLVARFDATAAYLYQDSAGTTPVTAVADPVGLQVNMVGADGALQGTAAARPLYDNTNTITGLAAIGVPRIKYDFSDDALLWQGATGTYWVCVANISGVQSYSVLITNGAKLPISEYIVMLIYSEQLSAANQTNVDNYLQLKRGALPKNSSTRWVFEIRGSSYVGRGGTITSGSVLWTYGGGTTKATMHSDTVVTTPREIMTFDLTVPTALTIFFCHINQLTGSIPSLTANTALTNFQCYNNQLTGSIPSLTANTALTIFSCHINQLTGSIPSLTANTALSEFRCYDNQLTGSIPSLTANTSLTTFYCHINQLTGSIPSLTANTALTNFLCDNNQLTGWGGGTVSATLGTFNASTNQLTEAAIDAILAAFVAAGKDSGTRILNIGGTGNAPPSAAGLADKTTLQSRGWTVTTN